MINVKALALTTLALMPVSVLAACGGATTTGTASSANSSATAAGTTAGTTPGGMQAGGPPGGMGTEATGSAATKAGDAATAKYPGTVERVMKLGDGSYVVHVMTDSGEQHVAVSAAFKVTGLQQRPAGGPPSGAAPGGAPGGAAPGGAAGGAAPDGAPQGTTPSTSSTTASPS